MRTLIEKKLLEILEQQGNMQTENLYYLKPAWAVLKAKEDMLREVLSELDVQRAVELQNIINREIDILDEASTRLTKELEILVDAFNEVESNAFLRLMGQNVRG
jgi:hypothetical protein